MTRELRYREALAEGLVQAMDENAKVFCLGVGVDDPKGIFGTTRSAFERFGSERVFDTPLSENAITGVCLGAAINGWRPVMVHARMDFVLLTLDQLLNNAAKWRYMSHGEQGAPIVIRAIVGRGWGQGPQHSQSLQALFAHVPGLKVTMPATPEDAKGLLIGAIRDDDPVLQIEHRWLYEDSGAVPEEPYAVPLGKAVVRLSGDAATIVAASAMVPEALAAAESLAADGIRAEVIDVRTISPLDRETIVASVKRTGRLIVADTGWAEFGLTAEVAATAAESAWEALKAPVERIALPPYPTPASWVLEERYYPGAAEIARAVRRSLGHDTDAGTNLPPARAAEFHGPF